MTTLNDQEKIERMYRALYGDEISGELGLVQMSREMYQAWSAIIWLGRVITAITIFIAAIGTAWMAFGAWFRHLVSGK